MRALAALIVTAIAAAAWLASERAVELGRTAQVPLTAVVRTDYQQCTTIRLPPIRTRPQFRGQAPIADVS